MTDCVIVTRPQADSEALAARLQPAGFNVVIAPLMRIETKPDAELPRELPQAIAFTSANGVAGLMAQSGAGRLLAVPVLAVGAASAGAARAAGFTDVTVSGGDVDALVQTVRETCQTAGGAILYPSGAHISGDLQGALAALGFAVARVVVYEAVHAGRMPDSAREAISAGQRTAVVLYSPRSAAIWSDLIAQANVDRVGAEFITYVCLSSNVEQTLRLKCGRGVRAVVANRPDEDAVVDALEAWRT